MVEEAGTARTPLTPMADVLPRTWDSHLAIVQEAGHGVQV